MIDPKKFSGIRPHSDQADRQALLNLYDELTDAQKADLLRMARQMAKGVATG